jgi:AAA domain, putative AbiEii toxin, Type IV TA system
MAINNEEIARLLNCDDNGMYRSNSPEGTQLIDENALNTPDKVQQRRAEMDTLVRQMQEGIEKTLSIDLDTGFSKGAIKSFIEVALKKPFQTIEIWVKDPKHDYHLVGKRLDRYLSNFLESRNVFTTEEVNLLEKYKNHKKTREEDYIKLIRRLRQPQREGIQYIEQGKVGTVGISGYFSVKGLDFKGLANHNEVYFVGENGDGKTLVLQALLMGLKWGELADKSTDREQIGRIVQYQNENPTLNIRVFDDNDNTFGRDNIAMRNVFAYGANRNLSRSEGYDPLGYLTLFYDNKALRSPIQWLKDLELDENQNQSPLKVETAIKLLEEILDNNVKITLQGSKITFSEDQPIAFQERNTEGLSFEQLSDGYRSVMTWVADMVARLANNQPTVKKIQDYEGIVIIDELGLHLHPKWEERLVAKLREWFPKIQFFISTHSPIMILSASRDAVFYRVYKENGVTQLSQPFYCEQMSDLMINSILTSPLFDLPDVLMRSFDPKKDDLDTNFEGYLSNRIRKKVNEEVRKKKDEGRVYISPEEIDNLIEETLNLNKNGKL